MTEAQTGRRKRVREEEIATDSEVTPQFLHQKKLMEDEAKTKAQYEAVETWYSVNGNKLLKHTRKKNGNVVSEFESPVKSAKDKAFVEELKKKNLLR